MTLFGVRLVGINGPTLHKLVLSVAFISAILLLRWLIVQAVRLVTGKEPNERVVFWTRQGSGLVTAILSLLAIVSIWFDDPTRLATGAGLFSAGLAFALQKVITSFAGYIVIMRGKTFSVGDRIVMGGVRGDVIALGFIQTQIMEMGQPPAVSSTDPAMWVEGRQFTGRIVTVSNDKVFDTPIYNYTREFPFIWDEIHIPIKYGSDRALAEKIILEATSRHCRVTPELTESARHQLWEKYLLKLEDLEPQVFYRLTDNWIELAVRFVVRDRGVREVKNKISREILDGFERHSLEIASSTYDIVGLPKVQVVQVPDQLKKPA